MYLGIFAKTFPRPNLEETLDAIVDHGLWHVQFNMACVGLPTLPERIDENLCRWIAQALRERGMTMAAISGTFNPCDPDEARLEVNLERLNVLAAACRWLDTRIITLCTGTRDPDDMWKHHPENVRRSAWQTLLRSTRRAVEIADRHEVTLAFEPEIHNVVSSVMRARKLLDEVGSPWLKVVIDPTNLFSRGEVRPLAELLREAFDWLGDDIVLAHAKPPDFGTQPDTNNWLFKFLGEKHREVNRGLQEMFSGVAESPLIVEAVGVERFTRVLENISRRGSFFRRYIESLKEAGYGGPLIIHGVSEVNLDDLASTLRRLFIYSEGLIPED